MNMLEQAYKNLADRFREDESNLDFHELMTLYHFSILHENHNLKNRVGNVVFRDESMPSSLILTEQQRQFLCELLDVVRDDPQHVSYFATAGHRVGLNEISSLIAVDTIYEMMRAKITR